MTEMIRLRESEKQSSVTSLDASRPVLLNLAINQYHQPQNGVINIET